MFFVCGLIKAVLGDLLRIRLTASASASGDWKFPAAANWQGHGNLLLPLAMDSRWLGFRMSPGGGGLFFFGARRNQTRPQIVIWQVLQTTRVSQNTTTNAFHALARSTLTPASRQRHASATPAAPMTHFELNLLAACCCDLLCIKSLPLSLQRKLTKLLHHEGPHAPCSDVHA